MEVLFPFSPPSFHLSTSSSQSFFSPPFKQHTLRFSSTNSDSKRRRRRRQIHESFSGSIEAESTKSCNREEEKFDWLSNWYPVALVCDLDKRVPHAKRVLGLDVVVWWDRSDGRWQVFDDKCPHRLAPLSQGRIDQWGRLQCVYHGWCFNGEGACHFIPQAPLRGPPLHTSKRACADVYPSVEQNRILWFWPSAEAQHKDVAMKDKPPYIPELDDPSYSSVSGMRDMPFGYEFLMENLMDPAHVAYAHYGIASLLPRAVKTRSRVKADREGGRHMAINVQRVHVDGYFGKHDYSFVKFVAPCLFHGFPKLGTANMSSLSMSIKKVPPKNAKQGLRRSTMVLLCVPVSPGRSRMIWFFPRNFSVWIDQLIPRWVFHLGMNLVLDSDLTLIQLEERKVNEVGPSNWQKACFVPTKSDALVVAFRKWLRMYAGNQVQWGSDIREGLPPTPPREQLMDRYWSHVAHCSSCRAALKGLKALELSLQFISIALIGLVAATDQDKASPVSSGVVVFVAVLCFMSSKWLSHFIYKSFYYHDYSHALK